MASLNAMPGRATLIATLTEPPVPEELERLSPIADVLEVRADLVGDPDPGQLRRHFPGRLLYTLRSPEEGGGEQGGSERGERLARAAGSYDLVDLEAERDLGDLAAKVEAEKRVVSWHGPALDLDDLRRLFRRMAERPAHLYKLVPVATQPRDALTPLALLKSVGRDDVLAFASGESAVWSRLLAPRLGAPVVFGAAGDSPGAAGQPSVETLREDFRLPSLPPVERLFGIVGSPVANSLSPKLHNAAYEALGLPALYLPFQTDAFGNLWLDVVESGSLDFLGFPLAGLSVTAPFKEVALAVAGASSPLAERIGSANTLVSHRGVWEAESTDPEGVLGALRSRGIEVAGRPCAVLGAGGAGRAAAFGLARAGAAVTLVNRGVERGRRVARELDVEFVPLSEFEAADFKVVVNATPLGREDPADLPFRPAELAPESLILDMAYHRRGSTALAAAGREAGVATVDGREVLFFQAVSQFLMMTGERLPENVARAVLALEPNG